MPRTLNLTIFHGNENLESVDIKNLKTGIIHKYKTDGTFIFIGYIPNTEFLKEKIDLNKWGEIVVKSDMSTSIAGVYSAGDSIEKKYCQVTTAVADGTIAALSAIEYLRTSNKTV
jgi:thioredoxin reductase (NADPH)